MCTSLTLTTGDPYFGRNLDLEYHFGQQVVMVRLVHMADASCFHGCALGHYPTEFSPYL